MIRNWQLKLVLGKFIVTKSLADTLLRSNQIGGNVELYKTTSEIVNITSTLFRRCGGGSAGAEQQHTSLKVGMGAGGGRISPFNDVFAVPQISIHMIRLEMWSFRYLIVKTLNLNRTVYTT